ncbi:MAG: hypothetical protein UI647_07300 [Negativibacillus sp.]
MIPYDKSGRRICTGGLSVALPSFLMETEEDERLSFGKRKNFSSQTAFIKLQKNDLQGAGRFFAVKFFADKKQKGCG